MKIEFKENKVVCVFTEKQWRALMSNMEDPRIVIHRIQDWPVKLRSERKHYAKALLAVENPAFMPDHLAKEFHSA